MDQMLDLDPKSRKRTNYDNNYKDKVKRYLRLNKTYTTSKKYKKTNWNRIINSDSKYMNEVLSPKSTIKRPNIVKVIPHHYDDYLDKLFARNNYVYSIFLRYLTRVRCKTAFYFNRNGKLCGCVFGDDYNMPMGLDLPLHKDCTNKHLSMYVNEWWFNYLHSADGNSGMVVGDNLEVEEFTNELY